LALVTDLDPLDRHALAVTIWTPAGLIAATLYHYGLGAGGALAIAAAFAVVLGAFAGHVIVNVVSGTAFTMGELALGLTLAGAGLLGLGAATLASPEFARRAFLPTSLGFVAVVVAFAFYMIAKSGVRLAFEAFDAIRSFSARDALEAGPDRRERP